MKLYYLTYKGYREEYTVMSESPENALQAIISYLKSESDIREKEANRVKKIYGKDYYNSEHAQYQIFKNATINSLPDKYTLEEYGVNQVIETEKC